MRYSTYSVSGFFAKVIVNKCPLVLKLRIATKWPKLIVRICWECLAEDPVKMVFNSYLGRSFNHIPEVVGNKESEWAVFHTAIPEAAA